MGARGGRLAPASGTRRGRLAKGEGPSGVSEPRPPCAHSLFEPRFESPTRVARRARGKSRGAREGSSRRARGKFEARERREREVEWPRVAFRNPIENCKFPIPHYQLAADSSHDSPRTGCSPFQDRALGSRPAPGTPSAKRSVGTRRAASMQDTLSEGTARAAQLAPSAVTAGAVGGSATRRVVGRVSPTTSGSSNAAQSRVLLDRSHGQQTP